MRPYRAVGAIYTSTELFYYTVLYGNGVGIKKTAMSRLKKLKERLSRS
jgi:hypothetical protein